MKLKVHENRKNKLQSLSKKMKTIFVVAFVVIVSSCSKSDDTPMKPEPKDQANAGYRVKEVQIASGAVSSRYQYNAKNQITQITYGNNTFRKFEYNALGLLMSSESGGNANPITDSKAFYTYDATGVLTELISKINNINNFKFLYTNNSSGLPTERKVYDWNTATSSWDEDLDTKAIYFYNANNQLVRDVRAISYTIFAYDDKGNTNQEKAFTKRPDGNFYQSYQVNSTFDDQKFHDLDPSPNIIVLKNNKLQDTNTGFNNVGVVNSLYSVNYTYDYNEAGYVTNQFFNGSLSFVYVLEKAQ